MEGRTQQGHLPRVASLPEGPTTAQELATQLRQVSPSCTRRRDRSHQTVANCESTDHFDRWERVHRNVVPLSHRAFRNMPILVGHQGVSKRRLGPASKQGLS